MKWVTRGTEQGSVVKFQEPKQEYEGIEEGLIAALKARRASMSVEGGIDWTDESKKRKRKKKTEVLDFDMFEKWLQKWSMYFGFVMEGSGGLGTVWGLLMISLYN